MMPDIYTVKLHCMQLLLEQIGLARGAWRRTRIKNNPKLQDIILSMRKILKTYKSVEKVTKFAYTPALSIDIGPYDTNSERVSILQRQANMKKPLITIPKTRNCHLSVALNTCADTWKEFQQVLTTMEPRENLLNEIERTNKVDL